MIRPRGWSHATKMGGRQLEPYLAANRRHWDELVDLHARSAFYDLEGFRADRCSLHSLELEEVGDVAGRTLLHLQCHFGMDTLSWARLGAKVTGVDFSEPAIALARSLSRELGIEARFICTDIYDLARLLDETFDLVFTSYGVLCWLPDLRPWGQLIASFLRPGGRFYIVENHPCANVFSYRRDTATLEVENAYFHSQHPIESDEQGTYADWNAILTNTVTYEWQHPLSEVTDALIGAGLCVEFLHEHPFCGWQRFPFMEQGEDGLWRLPENLRDRIPLTFSLMATRPG